MSQSVRKTVLLKYNIHFDIILLLLCRCIRVQNGVIYSSDNSNYYCNVGVRARRVLAVFSSEQNFPHHVAVGAVAVNVSVVDYTLGRTQVLQQRDTVFSAKVHEFDVLHAVIEKYT